MDKIACLQCGDKFEVDLKEAIDFMQHRADIGYLKSMRFATKESLEYFDNKDQVIFTFILSHCPYCREVGLSKQVDSPDFSRDKLTDEQYLRAMEKEMRQKSGWQIQSYLK